MSLPTQALASDVRSLEALRGKAATDPKGAAREAAKAFETLFMQELMKSMRSATLASGMLDNEGSQLGTEMLDQQLATRMAGLPGGLADAIVKQLERQMGGVANWLVPGHEPRQADIGPARLSQLQLNTLAPGRSSLPVGIPQKAAAEFVQTHTAAAQAAQSQTGLPAEFLISQAALETGWGQREIRHADGRSANNLFGIKAGPGWRGPVAEVLTTEYVEGRAQKVTARFRAYASPAESFADYAQLMKNSPRYGGVLAEGRSVEGFAQGLQKAGYATDPDYANKLTRVINTTLRMQRVVT